MKIDSRRKLILRLLFYCLVYESIRIAGRHILNVIVVLIKIDVILLHGTTASNRYIREAISPRIRYHTVITVNPKHISALQIVLIFHRLNIQLPENLVTDVIGKSFIIACTLPQNA